MNFSKPIRSAILNKQFEKLKQKIEKNRWEVFLCDEMGVLARPQTLKYKNENYNSVALSAK